MSDDPTDGVFVQSMQTEHAVVGYCVINDKLRPFEVSTFFIFEFIPRTGGYTFFVHRRVWNVLSRGHMAERRFQTCFHA